MRTLTQLPYHKEMFILNILNLKQMIIDSNKHSVIIRFLPVNYAISFAKLTASCYKANLFQFTILYELRFSMLCRLNSLIERSLIPTNMTLDKARSCIYVNPIFQPCNFIQILFWWGNYVWFGRKNSESWSDTRTIQGESLNSGIAKDNITGRVLDQ